MIPMIKNIQVTNGDIEDAADHLLNDEWIEYALCKGGTEDGLYWLEMQVEMKHPNQPEITTVLVGDEDDGWTVTARSSESLENLLGHDVLTQVRQVEDRIKSAYDVLALELKDVSDTQDSLRGRD